LDRPFTKKVMNYGMPLTVWIFIATFTLMADRYIIKEFYGYGAAGTYAAVKDLVNKISTFAILPLSIAYNAKINDAWNSRNTHKAKALIRELLLAELVVSLIVCACFLALQNLFYSKVLHLKGENLFFISFFLIISAFLWQAGLFFHKPLDLLFRQKTMVLFIVVSLVVNLGLNLLLIPKYGYPAAAVNALVSVFIYVLLSWIFSRHLMRKHALRESAHPDIINSL
jgi:O-antigen/teichoic acid export membrane protein